jgi:hypothetical protein
MHAHIYGYCRAPLDRRDGLFEPVPSSLLKYGAALVYGFRNLRQLPRYRKEWLELGSPPERQAF